ncbi:MAG TPA: alkaline phosphatase [Planctomycetaceae bacterium]|nr:alkaline phosphatase [Planctomycetaceae bacterium]HCK54913.1 alkaline phosphatase [Planctomycetaceae bacterium]
MHTPHTSMQRLSRRAFLKNGVLVLSSSAVIPGTAVGGDKTPALQIGLVTDLHYADKPPAGTRHYRETPAKLAEAAAELSKHKPAFLVELGDFIDAADSVKTELGYLKKINRDFSAICKNRHHVLGNHCVYTLTKKEFLETVGQKKSYYSFDSGNFHFIVLDSCFRTDGQPYGRKNFEWTDPNIPKAELDWLRADLKSTSKKTVVFAHQRLDVSSVYGVKNAPAVRKILEDSKQVLAVFQGHSHENDHKEIGGIHYCTLVAMIEGSGVSHNGYSVLKLSDDGSIRLDGFRNQGDYQWPSSS